jgi:drug/metabolite transporter (DMT)-like permease
MTQATSLAAASGAADSRLRGIALFCAALMLFVIMSTLVKHLARTYPMPEIIWARYFFHFVLMLAVFPHRIPTFLVSGRKGLQVLRGILMLTATLCTFSALQYLPMADIAAIGFTAPLIATALSVPILGEHVGPRRWAAIGVGFVGVIILIRPSPEVFQPVILLPLIMACLYAAYQITTRLVRDAAEPLNALFYTAIVGAVLTLPMIPFGWRMPDSAIDWMMLAMLGVLGGTGHFMIIEAYRRAPVSVIAPFSYTELIWAAALGYAFFGDVPDRWTVLGAGIIAASGLYVLHRERVRRGAD